MSNTAPLDIDTAIDDSARKRQEAIRWRATTSLMAITSFSVGGVEGSSRGRAIWNEHEALIAWIARHADDPSRITIVFSDASRTLASVWQIRK